MRKNIFSALMIGIVMVVTAVSVMGHPGRTDANGGHYNRKTGEYHYHNGGGSSSSSKSSSKNNSSSKASTYTAPKTVYATKVNVENMPSSIDAGESIKLNATAYPANSVDKDITWESSDTSVATVDSEGNLTAVGVGSVVIGAKTSRGTTSKFNLVVNEVFAENIMIDGKKDSVLIGEELQLSAIITPDNTTYKNVEWKSDNESVAYVDSAGKVKTLAVGKATITAVHKDLTDSFEIDVMPIQAQSVEISCINKETGQPYESLRFEKGKQIELSALVLPIDTTNPAVTWSSDNFDIANVDENGVVVGTAEGTVKITAETENGMTDTIEIEIYEISVIVNVIAGIIVFLMFAGIIGGPIAFIVWLRKKIKAKRSNTN